MIIKYLETQIEQCNELGGMEKEKWAFTQCLKKAKEAAGANKSINGYPQCPHCKNKLKVPPRAFRSIETYHSGVSVTTECCSNLVFLSGQMHFSASKGDPHRTEDSWGVKVKPKK